MKYWRGYLVAAIIAACSWGLKAFAETHTKLVDMVYPYVTRMIQSYLAQWSSGVDFCVWQVLLLVLVVLVLASLVLMFLFKWNVVQWGGWVLALVCAIGFANTAVYGLNESSSMLVEDIRLENTEYKYTLSELEAAAVFYRDKANGLADQVSRDENGDVVYPEFAELNLQAAEGFEILTYEKFHSVFAGSTLPVKALDWSGSFTSRGITGVTVPLTGEAAVNPETPTAIMPYVICREMAKRMCIATEQCANFAAFLSCDSNTAVEFQYAAYLMAYRYCYAAMKSVAEADQQFSLQNLEQGVGSNLQHDLDVCSEFFGKKEKLDESVCDLLVIWHIEQYVLPLMQEEEVAPFDPYDEGVVDLTGLI